MTKKILLNDINKVKSFVSTMQECPLKAEIVSGKCRVDARSIMGLLSLNLAKPIELRITTEDEDEAASTLTAIEVFAA